ncbi:hypothetical protein TNCV_1780091 [Trichonephila clavipes]|nr:hypothetical protein TNCV_1780091 [Trichonephila clavipes]
MSSTQWLPKPSRQIQGSYAGIECNQTTSDLLGASRHVYSHQNTARRIETRLSRRLCATSVSSFVVRRTKGAVSLYAGLSRKAEVMIAMLTVHAAENIVAP